MKNLYIFFIGIILLTGCISENESGMKSTTGYASNIHKIHMSTLHGTDDGSSNFQNTTIGQTVSDNPTSEGMGGGNDYSPPDPGASAPPSGGEPPGLPGG
tara:strand:+ start:64 stop:363 length:300 start_codon:yes stop_codon:yes gene_type:complete